MLRPINAIIKDSIGNIIHRGIVVTGEVTKDNGNKSYDVKIAGEEKEYPRVFTLSRNPDLAVGDKVRILYKNGCKELPIILPPVTAVPSIIRRYALIIAYPNEVKTFDMDGVVVHTLVAGGWSYAACDVTMDSDGNSYLETGMNMLRKYDSGGNLLVTHYREIYTTWFESVNIGPDGYLYTLEGRASGHAITKRDTLDLTVIEDVVTLATGYYGGGICLDSNGNFYIYNWQSGKIEKWSRAGAKLAEIDPGRVTEYAGCGVCGDYVYFVKDTNEVYYLPLDLSTYTKWDLPVSIAYCLTVADGHLILSGWGTGGDSATRKYDSSRNLIWEVLHDPAYAYKAGGYNF